MKKENGTFYDGSLDARVDSTVAAYWQGSVTRKELQDHLTIISPVIQELVLSVHGDKDKVPPTDGLVTIIAKMDLVIAFLVQKFGITGADINAWQEEQVKAFMALQKEAPAVAAKPTVTLD
jgi:hypothetical protein